MKDRMTLGRDADVAETAALMLADENAERRMFDELDREAVERYEAELEKLAERRKNAAIQRVRRALGDDCANVAYACFNRKTWKDVGIPRATFFHRLKSENIFPCLKIKAEVAVGRTVRGRNVALVTRFADCL